MGRSRNILLFSSSFALSCTRSCTRQNHTCRSVVRVPFLSSSFSRFEKGREKGKEEKGERAWRERVE